jgi:hypothetical protein
VADRSSLVPTVALAMVGGTVLGPVERAWRVDEGVRGTFRR